jgi:hypothetical protein
MYAVAIPLAFVSPWIAVVLYLAIALIWFVPDRRIEAILKQRYEVGWRTSHPILNHAIPRCHAPRQRGIR